jgi:DNA polymerase III subunit delta'
MRTARLVYTRRSMENAALPVLLERALASGRLHSAYLISGPREAARGAALAFARASVCARSALCEVCDGCHRSGPREEIAIDGTGHHGPLFRRIGDHPDLFWVERGSEDTRVRIGQIRALQHGLRLQGGEGGRRIAVIADAEWLNQEAQNALLRLLEEPPPRTTLVLVTTSPAGLLATVRSRCQKVALAAEHHDPLADPAAATWLSRLDALPGTPLPALLDWAEEFRGQRAAAAGQLEEWLVLASAWLRRRIAEHVGVGRAVRGELDAARELSRCRQSLVQRNANPQMTAERALLALQAAVRT